MIQNGQICEILHRPTFISPDLNRELQNEISDKMSFSKGIEPFIQKYPSWFYFTGAGGRMLKENSWNTGIKKNIPRHYKVGATNNAPRAPSIQTKSSLMVRKVGIEAYVSFLRRSKIYTNLQNLLNWICCKRLLQCINLLIVIYF